MTQKNKIKKLFFSFLLLEMLLFFAPAVYAQVQPYDYSKAGVSDQIKLYLCAPTDDNKGTYGTFGNDPVLGQGQAGANNKAGGDLYLCINKIYRFAIVGGGVVGVFFIVIGGYLYMSAEGNSESLEKAKSMLISTITALVILFIGYILLKALNPDLIQFRSIQPPSVKMEKAPSPEGTGGIPPGMIGKTGIAGCGGTADGSACDDYTKNGFSAGNSTQKPGLNTFLTKSLIAKLVSAKSKNPNFRITEAYPPTVDHRDPCHSNGSCADIGSNSTDTGALNSLCQALTSSGLTILNEYVGIADNQVPACGKSVATSKTTGGHLHVK